MAAILASDNSTQPVTLARVAEVIHASPQWLLHGTPPPPDGYNLEVANVVKDQAQGRRIASIQVGRDLHDRDVAFILGVEEAQVTRARNGNSSLPTEDLITLAEVMGVDPHWLICGIPPAPPWHDRYQRTIDEKRPLHETAILGDQASCAPAYIFRLREAWQRLLRSPRSPIPRRALPAARLARSDLVAWQIDHFLTWNQVEALGRALLPGEDLPTDLGDYLINEQGVEHERRTPLEREAASLNMTIFEGSGLDLISTFEFPGRIAAAAFRERAALITRPRARRTALLVFADEIEQGDIPDLATWVQHLRTAVAQTRAREPISFLIEALVARRDSSQQVAERVQADELARILFALRFDGEPTMRLDEALLFYHRICAPPQLLLVPTALMGASDYEERVRVLAPSLSGLVRNLQQLEWFYASHGAQAATSADDINRFVADGLAVPLPNGYWRFVEREWPASFDHPG